MLSLDKKCNNYTFALIIKFLFNRDFLQATPLGVGLADRDFKSPVVARYFLYKRAINKNLQKYGNN
ncbi:MAG: hypothetical protein ACOCV8_00035 [Spirochaetota bacterium]